jgi:hypothetical protein
MCALRRYYTFGEEPTVTAYTRPPTNSSGCGQPNGFPPPWSIEDNVQLIHREG